MRLGQKIKGFFRKVGRGIKKGATWLFDKGKKVVKTVAKGAVKAVGKAGGVLGTVAGGALGSIIPGAGTAARQARAPCC